MEVASKYVNALESISSVWPATEQQSLRWDRYRGVLATDRSGPTYRALFGHPSIRAAQWGAKTIRRLRKGEKLFAQGTERLITQVPKDAVLIPLGSGLVVASAGSKQVLKIVFGWPDIEREIQIWPIAKEAGLEKHVPRLIDHGKFEKQGSWMVTRLVPNTWPFIPQLPSVWSKWLRKKVLPWLRDFYNASGITETPADKIVGELDQSISAGPLRVALERVKEARQNRVNGSVLESRVHGDLKNAHIHRSNKNWWLIDWGTSRERAIHHELLGRYLTKPVKKKNKEVYGFWMWLLGNARIAELPDSVKHDLQLFLWWRSTFSQSKKERLDSIRWQILADSIRYIHNKISESECKDIFSSYKHKNIYFEPLTRHALYRLEALVEVGR